MHKSRTNAAPLILAIVLLLLPVLYVTSYVALVAPSTPTFSVSIGVVWSTDPNSPFDPEPNYRMGGEWSALIFWPLEQIDRKLRPGAWNFEPLIIEAGGFGRRVRD